MNNWQSIVRWSCVVVAAVMSLATTGHCEAAVVWDTVVSLEDPIFVPARAQMVVGKDGRVYLSCPTSGASFSLTMNPDGADRRGVSFGHVQGIEAVAADGSYAVRCGHFTHTVAVFDRAGVKLSEFNSFNNENFDSPQSVEIGASGDFYAADRYADRIVRLDRHGHVVKVYNIPHRLNGRFRVCRLRSV